MSDASHRVPAGERARAFHDRVVSTGNSFNIRRSTLTGSLSSHELPDSTELATLLSMQTLARTESCGDKSFVGSISGKLVFSVNVAYVPPNNEKSKKRRIDTTMDDATRAVDRIKRSLKDASSVTERSYTIAKNAVASLLKIKGASGENALESWALSLRKQGEYGSVPRKDGRSNLVIAVRISAGVAVSILDVSNALSACRDGMITVSCKSVADDFDLPMTEQCMEAHQQGQKSILFLVSVPHVDDPDATAQAADAAPVH